MKEESWSSGRAHLLVLARLEGVGFAAAESLSAVWSVVLVLSGFLLLRKDQGGHPDYADSEHQPQHNLLGVTADHSILDQGLG